ncbi:efflux RND transporter periplasmic adaptor subunit [Novosphingobium aerophilum]|uniref:efflux RND transporter periplasmic adaptor subunit n=1 Tax=Novosphingobium TaxID=165696 RepID=UPI00104C02C3|nr:MULTISPECIES: efflux RND transporter periplasmic adaptor subunit [unclassified Novosphingobium]MPS67504.1 efflux RND transporter periplasmic adaptor subunit [Novosphingobium sp.]TCM43039.1 RND family efflux transporter MFP subunit [Novosphingobium sp. ST904]WRT93229.1 efflux RND transporter periplasmic adaptor subunit [Novosphingobium sp. RL4]
MNYDSRIDVSENEGFTAPGNPLEGDVERDRASRRWLWIAIVGAVVLAIGIWFATRGGGEASAAGENDVQTPAVTVVVPGRASVVGEISATGSLAARRPMPVGSVGEGGQVRSVLVEAGDWVSQGQVLAVIDRSVQAQQQAGQSAQISVAEADARLAQANLDRALKLVDRGFISAADVDRLKATRDAAVAQVRVARATLGQLQAQTARLNIVAPAAGLVLERNVELGQVVGGGSAVLFRLAKGGEMELLAQLSEDDLARLSVGVEATVTPTGSNQSFTGQVWQIAPIIDSTNRQGIARIALAYNDALRPGGFASVVINSGQTVAPVLPESAIQNDDKGSFVYVVDAKNVVHRRAVQTGLVTGKGIVVKSGIDGNEKIVLRAGGFLNDGDKVKPQLAAKAD